MARRLRENKLSIEAAQVDLKINAETKAVQGISNAPNDIQQIASALSQVAPQINKFLYNANDRILEQYDADAEARVQEWEFDPATKQFIGEINSDNNNPSFLKSMEYFKGHKVGRYAAADLSRQYADFQGDEWESLVPQALKDYVPEGASATFRKAFNDETSKMHHQGREFLIQKAAIYHKQEKSANGTNFVLGKTTDQTTGDTLPPEIAIDAISAGREQFLLEGNDLQAWDNVRLHAAAVFAQEGNNELLKGILNAPTEFSDSFLTDARFTGEIARLIRTSDSNHAAKRGFEENAEIADFNKDVTLGRATDGEIKEARDLGWFGVDGGEGEQKALTRNKIAQERIAASNARALAQLNEPQRRLMAQGQHASKLLEEYKLGHIGVPTNDIKFTSELTGKEYRLTAKEVKKLWIEQEKTVWQTELVDEYSANPSPQGMAAARSNYLDKLGDHMARTGTIDAVLETQLMTAATSLKRGNLGADDISGEELKAVLSYVMLDQSHSGALDMLVGGEQAQILEKIALQFDVNNVPVWDEKAVRSAIATAIDLNAKTDNPPAAPDMKGTAERKALKNIKSKTDVDNEFLIKRQFRKAMEASEGNGSSLPERTLRAEKQVIRGISKIGNSTLLLSPSKQRLFLNQVQKTAPFASGISWEGEVSSYLELVEGHLDTGDVVDPELILVNAQGSQELFDVRLKSSPSQPLWDFNTGRLARVSYDDLAKRAGEIYNRDYEAEVEKQKAEHKAYQEEATEAVNSNPSDVMINFQEALEKAQENAE